MKHSPALKTLRIEWEQTQPKAAECGPAGAPEVLVLETVWDAPSEPCTPLVPKALLRLLAWVCGVCARSGSLSATPCADEGNRHGKFITCRVLSLDTEPASHCLHCALGTTVRFCLPSHFRKRKQSKEGKENPKTVILLLSLFQVPAFYFCNYSMSFYLSEM